MGVGGRLPCVGLHWIIPLRHGTSFMLAPCFGMLSTPRPPCPLHPTPTPHTHTLYDPALPGIVIATTPSLTATFEGGDPELLLQEN